MAYVKCVLALILLIAAVATPGRAATSIADGDWNASATWDGGAPPDQAANGGNGEAVFINSNVTATTGVDYVNTTTIDTNGDPVDGNLWMFFDAAAELGSSLTIEDGARVGSKFWTQVVGGADDAAAVHIQSGGEYVTAGVNNGSTAFTINVEPGGLLTFDASIHPAYPVDGFYRGNISAGETASNVFNVEGRLDVVNMSNTNAAAGAGSNTYHLINGGVINEVPLAGQAIGINSPGTALPDGNVSYDAISITGSGRVINAFGGAGITNVPAGLTVDIADQSIFDADGIGEEWSTWVTGNGGDPTMLGGPRSAPIAGGDTDSFTGSGAIQFDIYGFEVNDQGTPDPGDDTLGAIFNDQLFNGPGAANESTFSGMFEIGYVGPEITDELVALINTSFPAVLLINGATNGSFFEELEELPVPDQVWSDGVRQFDVTFADTFFFDLGDPFPAGTPDTRLVFTTIESITPRADGLAGDYNSDGKVDAADYVVWRDTGINGQQGYDDWRTNFGATAMTGDISGSGAIATPEPTALVLIAMAALTMLGGSRSCR